MYALIPVVEINYKCVRDWLRNGHRHSHAQPEGSVNFNGKENRKPNTEHRPLYVCIHNNNNVWMMIMISLSVNGRTRSPCCQTNNLINAFALFRQCWPEQIFNYFRFSFSFSRFVLHIIMFWSQCVVVALCARNTEKIYKRTHEWRMRMSVRNKWFENCKTNKNAIIFVNATTCIRRCMKAKVLGLIARMKCAAFIFLIILPFSSRI